MILRGGTLCQPFLFVIHYHEWLIFLSEPYLTGSLCGETILFLFWIYLTFVIFVLDCSPLYTPCVLGCLFLINEFLLLIKKKKKNYHEWLIANRRVSTGLVGRIRVDSFFYDQQNLTHICFYPSN